ncbi:serine/threonine protein kinase [Labilithrix luteola]|uniref:Serine/threonine protein kinase n=1 Tax=Labilithrix luteola TaxID=1391654 RepID=A0A0K1Q644_9BACT|nr:serine/threonine-protein kinase [Labilithrix luteola]AKV01286.1 serine/threonine protein kinase [Labilithrix luteola]
MLISAMARSTVAPRPAFDAVRGTADTAPAVEANSDERQAPKAPVTIGSVVADKYRIDEVLGAGGMGIVMAATHLGLGQRVALKFLVGPAATTRSGRARLMREARAAASLESEHSVRVTDVGSLEDGTPYLVMELLRGTDLGRLLEDAGPLPIELALDVTLQACEAVAEAHGRGIIHRDLKPANLFLAERSDGTRIVKVLDFGISKVESAGEAQITTSDAMIGSPRYMSPEQMVSSRLVDARTDVWSIGVVLFELVTARPPFEADTIAGLCAVVATAAAPDVRTYRKDAPERLAEVIRKCLSKEPQKRYGSIAELAEELRVLSPPALQHTIDRIARRASGAPALTAYAKSSFEATTASTSKKKPVAMIAGAIGAAAALAVALVVVVGRKGPDHAVGVAETTASIPSVSAAAPVASAEPVAAPSLTAPPAAASSTNAAVEAQRVDARRPADVPPTKLPKRSAPNPAVVPVAAPAPSPTPSPTALSDHPSAVPETKSSGLIDRK